MAITTLTQPSINPIKVGSRVIGHLDGNRFIKHVRGSKHKLRYPQAWAIDANAFDNEIKPLATTLTIIDKETGTEYCCTIETFDAMKGEIDRGFGRQYFMTLDHWEVNHA